LKNIIKKIFKHPDLINKPPVLIDIGASGSIFSGWELIAPYSICISFDADARDFEVTDSLDSGYKRLISLNRLVDVNKHDESDFYLTKSPHCSSGLKPDQDSLRNWSFHDLFEVTDKVALPTTTIAETLNSFKLDYVDWFKVDSQGQDLRLFCSVPNHMKGGVIALDFEPGIIDAYHGEDKLFDILAWMERQPFWLEDFRVKGVPRQHSAKVPESFGLAGRSRMYWSKSSPCWAELSYLNSFTELQSVRSLLLGWIIATMRGQHEFASIVAEKGLANGSSPELFGEMLDFSSRTIGLYSSNLSIIAFIFSRVFDKIFSR